MNNKSYIYRVFIFIWIFLITLQSYYSYNFNVAIPPTMAAILALAVLPRILLMQKSRNLSNAISKIWLYWMYLIFTGILLSIAWHNIMITRFIATPLFLASGIFFVYLLDRKREDVSSAIHLVLKIHVIAFLIQFVSYYSGFGYIDFLSPFTGEEQRAMGGSFYIDEQAQKQLIRPTGLFNEPGTYSNIIFILFIIYQNITYNTQNTKNFKIFDWTLILTIVFSFSIFGIIFVGIYTLLLIKNNKKLILPISIFIFISIPFIYKIYILPRFFSGAYDDSGVEFRLTAISSYINFATNDNLLSLIFGTGFFSDASYEIGTFVWNDLGLIFYMFITTGLFGVLIFLFVCNKSISKNNTGIILLILSLTKISISMVLFWPILGFLLYVKYFNIKDNSKNSITELRHT